MLIKYLLLFILNVEKIVELEEDEHGKQLEAHDNFQLENNNIFDKFVSTPKRDKNIDTHNLSFDKTNKKIKLNSPSSSTTLMTPKFTEKK